VQGIEASLQELVNERDEGKKNGVHKGIRGIKHVGGVPSFEEGVLRRRKVVEGGSLNVRD